MNVPYSRIENALHLLRENPKRQVYEWGGENGRGGTGRYLVSYPPPGPRLELGRKDIEWMLRRGWLEQVQPGLYNRGHAP